MIPYTPEQLIALANKEFAWCEEEMKKASRALGYGDDWKKAIEHTKETYVPPGEQPHMIMGLLNEAIDYLRANDLITVPSVAAESLHMTMSPQEQLTPLLPRRRSSSSARPTRWTIGAHEMRGQQSRLLACDGVPRDDPGHNLVGSWRASGLPRTGGGGSSAKGGRPHWADDVRLGLDKTPEQKVGALFWRMHRCAHHLSPQLPHGAVVTEECITSPSTRSVTSPPMPTSAGSFESPQCESASLSGGVSARRAAAARVS
jgi:hypothetical protein